ncbi:hypothetical protein [Sphingobacterium cellulitidis]|uniref:hypothetical protein n=1 Tax=Sphingobacterium cellulitidis TaxID=1768011 RepID=UPI0011818E6C|nr:hypothetical protein [Sphingobacterium cellulitidis]
MKTSIILIAVLAVITASCKSDRTKAFIPGTYVNSATGGYSTADDTLTIVPTDVDTYNIHRRTGYNRIREGKKGQREHETEQWQAVYDKATKTLIENRMGKHITFYPESNSLRVGTREYHKVN